MSDVNFGFNIRNLGYLPRWLILLLDLFIIFSSGIISYFLLKGIRFDFIPKPFVIYALAIYSTVNLFYFWIFRTYSGIIRHSSYIDALKLFFSQFSTFVTLLIINLVLILLEKPKLFLTTGLFINAILSFSLLFFYRIVVKQVFEKYINPTGNQKRKNALIYGLDANAIAVAGALNSENPSRFKLLGFIDKNNLNTSKRILNLPIFKIKKSIPVLMRLLKAEALIIADRSLTKEEKSVIVDECIDYGFKVFTLPVVTDWEDEKEISKNIKNFEIQDLLERKPIVLDMDLISQTLAGKVILVTGAAGSIGSEIVRQVLGFNPGKIIILDQAETPLNSLSLEINMLNSSVPIINIIGDIRVADYLELIFKNHKPDVVFHAAAYKHVPMMEENPAQAVFTNVMGTKNLADLAQKYHVETFVMVSTDKAVNPSNVMGASKRIAEMYVQSKHFKNNKQDSKHVTKFITTRFGNVLGSNGSVVPLFTKQINEGGPVTITHPEIIRYFMTIPEACQLVLEAGSMGKGGEIFIFDMGKPVKIIDLAKKMIKLAGLVPDKDVQIKIVGLRPGEKLYEELLSDSARNLATHHEKIMIAVEVCDEFDKISAQIEELTVAAKVGNSDLIVSVMKKMVPEFISMNSVFQTLDIEVNDPLTIKE